MKDVKRCPENSLSSVEVVKLAYDQIPSRKAVSRSVSLANGRSAMMTGMSELSSMKVFLLTGKIIQLQHHLTFWQCSTSKSVAELLKPELGLPDGAFLVATY